MEVSRMENKKKSSLIDFLDKISIEDAGWFDYGNNCMLYLNYRDQNLEYRFPIKYIDKYENNIRLLKKNQMLFNEFIKFVEFSVGNKEYYEFLTNELTYEVKCEWLELVNDIAFSPKLFYRMEKIIPKDLVKSFMRGINRNEIDTILNDLAHQSDYGDISRQISVEIRHFKEDASSFVLTSEKFQHLPSNTYVIIGKNGCGKTRFLDNLVTNFLTGPKENYYFSTAVNHLLYVSFSPFDFRSNSIYETKEKLEFLGIPEITLKTASIMIDSLLPKMYCEKKYIIKELYTEEIRAIYSKNKKEEILDLKKDIEKKNELMNYYYGLKPDETVNFRSINNDNILLLELQNTIFEFFNPIKSEERKLLFTIFSGLFPNDKFADVITAIIKKREITRDDLYCIKNFSSGQKILSISLLGLIMFSIEKSVILIDEPETFLHPPMIKQYIQSINRIAKEKNSICVLTTHSPIVIQELPNECVFNLKDGKLSIFPDKTFGEDLLTLYNKVYGLEESRNGYSIISSYNTLSDNEIEQLGNNAYIDWLYRNEEG